MSAFTLETARHLLCALEDHIRETVLQAQASTHHNLADVATVTAADTIYRIDKITEAAILTWFARHWPASEPIQLVMEGLPDDIATVVPTDTPVAETRWKCIIDPIDGTRNIMYDKRSAWALAALAPQRGPDTMLSDIVVAAMTELPTTKQWRSDQISVVKGRPIVAEAVDVRQPDNPRQALGWQLSQATDFRHGFAAISRFFPEGKGLLAALEETLWDRLYGLGSTASPLVFDDQYLCTGGQLYELLVGHDRMLADLRPLVLPKLGYDSALVCHPYDICTALILQEAGAIIEAPDGQPLDVPLDTTSAVAWVGYANPVLAQQVRPHLQQLLIEYELV